jgi:hypothetical protein
MQAIMKSATRNTEDGRVKVTLSTSTNAGYANTCEQYNDYGHYSVPLPTGIVNIEQQTLSNVVVTGYNNTITDEHFTLQPGESANYSTGWYQIRANDGVYIQKANTTSKENEMMGNSTNHILRDILNRLIALETWADAHKHNPGTFEVSLPGTLNPGGPTIVSVTGVSENPTVASPSGDNISADATYIANNKNLAGSTYTPY